MTRVLFLILAVVGHCLELDGEVRDCLQLNIGDEFVIIPDGLRPYVFVSRRGTVFVQSQMPTPDEPYPGRWEIARSTDRGATWNPWSPAKEQGDGPFTEGCITELRDGTILILESQAVGPTDDGRFIGKLWQSNDELATISGPIDATFSIPDGAGGFDDVGRPVNVLFLHRTLLEMPDGSLLATAYGWFKQDTTPSSYEPNMMRFRSILVRSRDRGRNWSLVATIASDPNAGEEGFNEPVLARLTRGPHAGRLIALLRVGSNFKISPSPLHQAESDDNGRTWNPPRALAFDGVDPDLIELGDGTLAAGFGWRSRESRQPTPPGQAGVIGPEHGNYVAFSFDQGRSWGQVAQVTNQGTTGYVTLREIQPNKLLLIYDRHDPNTRATLGRFITMSR